MAALVLELPTFCQFQVQLCYLGSVSLKEKNLLEDRVLQALEWRNK